MALNYRLTDVADWHELAESQPGTIECLSFACLFVGLDRIDAHGKSDWRTFFRRLRAWELAIGPLSTSGEPIPPETVRRFVGFKTNASTMSAAAFKRHLADAAIRKAQADLDRLDQNEDNAT